MIRPSWGYLPLCHVLHPSSPLLGVMHSCGRVGCYDLRGEKIHWFWQGSDLAWSNGALDMGGSPSEERMMWAQTGGIFASSAKGEDIRRLGDASEGSRVFVRSCKRAVWWIWTAHGRTWIEKEGERACLDLVFLACDLSPCGTLLGWTRSGELVRVGGDLSASVETVSEVSGVCIDARVTCREDERAEVLCFLPGDDGMGVQRALLLVHAGGGEALVERVQWLPPFVDARVRSCVVDGERVLRSPTSNGAWFLKEGTLEKLRFVGAEELRGPHMRHTPVLRRLGLRWDGEELYLDRFSQDQMRFYQGAREEEWPSGPLQEPQEVLDADKTHLLKLQDDDASRVLWWRIADKEGPWVLPHPSLARILGSMRHESTTRPRVALRAWGFDPEGDYLALWRNPGGVELWSLRAHDRLKAWAWGGRGGGRARVLLRREETPYVPLLFVLETDGEDVQVARVEFGDHGVRALGVCRGCAGYIDDMEPVDPEGLVWEAENFRWTLVPCDTP